MLPRALEICRPHFAEEIRILALEAIGRAALRALAFEGDRWIHIEEERRIRLQPRVHEVLERDHDVGREAASSALVSVSCVAEPVADDPAPAGERRLDHACEMLAARGEHDQRLGEAWAARDPSLPLAAPYQALILASIIEKETGINEERALVASVFVNRLNGGMRLQTDPTVIYGMGETFEGNIRKKDLTADTEWNTYTRDGLPPTPIAMPGAASLAAAVKPAATPFLYFVAKGDGTHQFSRSLEEHNRAVAKYQLRK